MPRSMSISGMDSPTAEAERKRLAFPATQSEERTQPNQGYELHGQLNSTPESLLTVLAVALFVTHSLPYIARFDLPGILSKTYGSNVG
jgi:hypothetical protein